MSTTWCLEGTAWFCDVFGPFWVMHICSSIWRGVNREEPHGSTDTLCVCSFYPGTTRSLKLFNWFSRYLLSRFPGTQVTTQACLAPVSYLPSIRREALMMSSPLWAWQYCLPAPGGVSPSPWMASCVSLVGPSTGETMRQRTHQLPGAWYICSGRVFSSLVKKDVVFLLTMMDCSTGMCQCAVKY